MTTTNATAVRTGRVTEDGVVRHLATMHDRTTALRRQARGVNPVLARAYRRRAAEIQLGAWAYALRTGHPDWARTPT